MAQFNGVLIGQKLGTRSQVGFIPVISSDLPNPGDSEDIQVVLDQTLRPTKLAFSKQMKELFLIDVDIPITSGEILKGIQAGPLGGLRLNSDFRGPGSIIIVSVELR